MNLIVKSVRSLEEKEKSRTNSFILDDNTNGEFINSIEYLSYHPEKRFNDESIVIIDRESGSIKCVLMAASTHAEPYKLISHPGTTFSGLVCDKNLKYDELMMLIDVIEEHYKELNYKEIILKMTPAQYGEQPYQVIEYALMMKAYNFGITAMVNMIDLFKVKNEVDVFSLYSSGRRNHVKSSIKKDVLTFSKLDYLNKEIWDNINDNLKNKFGTNTTHSYDEIEELCLRFPQNISSYVVYKDGNEYGAFALVFKFKNVFHTQYLDMNYSLSGYYPNLYLMHYLICEAIILGYRFFSFGSSTESSGAHLNEGLYNYKNGFGGGSILLPKYTKKIE